MPGEHVRGFPASGAFILEFHRNPSHICCDAPEDDVSPSFPLAYGSRSAITTFTVPVCLTWHVGSRSAGGGCPWPSAEGSDGGSEGIIFSFTHHRPHSKNGTPTGWKHSNISHSAVRILGVMCVMCGPLGIVTDPQQMEAASSLMFNPSSGLFQSPEGYSTDPSQIWRSPTIPWKCSSSSSRAPWNPVPWWMDTSVDVPLKTTELCDTFLPFRRTYRTAAYPLIIMGHTAQCHGVSLKEKKEEQCWNIYSVFYL